MNLLNEYLKSNSCKIFTIKKTKEKRKGVEHPRKLTGKVEFILGIQTEPAPSGEKGLGHGRNCLGRMKIGLIQNLAMLVNSLQRRRGNGVCVYAYVCVQPPTAMRARG